MSYFDDKNIYHGGGEPKMDDIETSDTDNSNEKYFFLPWNNSKFPE